MSSRSDSCRAVVLAALGAMFVNVEPAIASAIAGGFHLAPNALGIILGLESAGAIIGGVLAYALLRRLEPRALGAYALLLYILANAATITVSSTPLLAAARALTGIAEGAMIAIAFVILSLGRAPHRLFAVFGIVQTGSSVVAFPLLTWLIHIYGWQATFALFAVVGVASVFALPSRGTVLHDTTAERTVPGAAALRGLTSVLIFFCAQASIWPFLERIGAQRGVGDFALAGALSFGALCGLLGSFGVTLLPSRFSGFKGCAAAAIINAVAIVTLGVAGTPATFIAALGSFNFAWAAFAPLQLHALKRLDADPGIFALASTATTAGFTLGPIVGGLTINGTSYVVPLAVGVLGTFVALALLIPAPFRRRALTTSRVQSLPS